MFGMGMPEIIVILAIALIVLGPKKLPEIAKSLGRGIAEFKKATQDFKENIDVDNDFKEAKDTIQGIKGDLERGVRQSVSGESVSRESVSGESVSGGGASMEVQKPQNEVSAETGGAPSEESEAGSSDDDVTGGTATSEAFPPEEGAEEGEEKEKGSAKDA